MNGRPARRGVARARGDRGAAVRARPERRGGRRRRVLPAARRAGGVRAAAGPGGADARRRRRCGGTRGWRRRRWSVSRCRLSWVGADRALAREKRRWCAKQLAVPRAEFRSYYGRPILKTPAWDWMIAAYLFRAGCRRVRRCWGRRGPDGPAGAAAGVQGGRAGEHRGEHVLPGRGSGQARAVPPHAAGGQAELADERGHVDPHRPTGRGRVWPGWRS